MYLDCLHVTNTHKTLQITSNLRIMAASCRCELVCKSGTVSPLKIHTVSPKPREYLHLSRWFKHSQILFFHVSFFSSHSHNTNYFSPILHTPHLDLQVTQCACVITNNVTEGDAFLSWQKLGETYTQCPSCTQNSVSSVSKVCCKSVLYIGVYTL